MAGKPKLSDWEMDELCSRLRRGARVFGMAHEYGVSERTVYRIARAHGLHYDKAKQRHVEVGA